MVSAATDRRTALETKKAGLVAYLRLQVEGEDWHAIQDVASDIRELDARLDELTRAEARRGPPDKPAIDTDVPVCGAPVTRGGRCVLPAAHEGLHRNADGWEG